MAEDTGGQRGVLIALIGGISLVIGACIGAYATYRSSDLAAAQFEATRAAEVINNQDNTILVEVTRLTEPESSAPIVEEKEVTRIVEVTREVEVERIVEVTRIVQVTQILEVTRIVEVTREPPSQDSSPNPGISESQDDATGGIIIGVFYNDGSLAWNTRSVTLIPKTLVNAAGELIGDNSREVRLSYNAETSLAEGYALEPGRYLVCYHEPSITDLVGEVDIVAGEVIRKDFRWTTDTDWGGGCDE